MIEERHKRLEARIREFPLDVKAEIIAADLVDNGMSLDEIYGRPNSIFSRRFGKDVMDAHYTIHNDDSMAIYLELARDGFYDMLPEGLFHQPKERKSFRSVAEMRDQVKIRRAEEKESRKFFFPIENEFFQHRVRLEILERKVFQQLEDGKNNELFLEFWNLLPYRKLENIGILVRLLPLAYRIAGDLPLARLCFELVLDCPVNFEVKAGRERPLNEESLSSGNCHLGLDMVLGNTVLESSPALEIGIGPLSGEQLLSFLEGGEKRKMLELLSSYFLPIEMDFYSRIFCGDDNYSSTLDSDDESAMRLGLNSRLASMDA